MKNLQIKQAQFDPASQAGLQSRGFAVRQTPLTEFMKAGGSARCLMLKLTEARLPVVQAIA